jgi:hypothetical protein
MPLAFDQLTTEQHAADAKTLAEYLKPRLVGSLATGDGEVWEENTPIVPGQTLVSAVGTWVSFGGDWFLAKDVEATEGPDGAVAGAYLVKDTDGAFLGNVTEGPLALSPTSAGGWVAFIVNSWRRQTAPAALPEEG